MKTDEREHDFSLKSVQLGRMVSNQSRKPSALQQLISATALYQHTKSRRRPEWCCEYEIE